MRYILKVTTIHYRHFDIKIIYMYIMIKPYETNMYIQVIHVVTNVDDLPWEM